MKLIKENKVTYQMIKKTEIQVFKKNTMFKNKPLK